MQGVSGLPSQHLYQLWGCSLTFCRLLGFSWVLSIILTATFKKDR